MASWAAHADASSPRKWRGNLLPMMSRLGLALFVFTALGCGGRVLEVSDSGVGDVKPDTYVDSSASDVWARRDVELDSRWACGACGCSTSRLWEGGDFIWGVGLDAERVYWVSTGGRIMSVRKCGADARVLATGQVNATGLAVDSNDVLFTVDYDIRRISKSGGAVEVVLTDSDGPAFLSIYRDSVYWTTYQGGVKAARVDGGGVHAVALAQGRANSAYPNIVADATGVYWTSFFGDAGQVAQLPSDGGSVRVLVPGLAGASGQIALGQSEVFWNGGCSGVVYDVSKAGGAVATVLDAWVAQGVAVDGTDIYWGDYRAGLILQRSVSGGTVTTIADGQDLPTLMMQDVDYVYWTDLGCKEGKKCSLNRAAKRR